MSGFWLWGGRSGVRPPPDVWPAIPPREVICRPQTRGMQGLYFDSDAFGANTPLWDPDLTSPQFTPADFQRAQAVKRAAGDTHWIIDLTGAYNESGLIAPWAGRDFTGEIGKGLKTFRQYLVALIQSGFWPIVMLGGDGMSVPKVNGQWVYNDPVGWTYGQQWLMVQFPRIFEDLQGDGSDSPSGDLTTRIVSCPAYDGAVPGWQPPSLVDECAFLMRETIGASRHMMIELSAGYCVWAGNEFNNWITRAGQCFDVIAQEFPYVMQAGLSAPPAAYLDRSGRNWLPNPPVTPDMRAPWDQCWQMLGRCLRQYQRPAEQPDNDDPGGAPFILGAGTPRGPYEYWAMELDTYGFVREGRAIQSQIERHRQYLYDRGCPLVG